MLKKGDKVRIVDFPPKDRHEAPVFTIGMEQTCGRVGTIRSVWGDGEIFTIKIGNSIYDYKSNWLMPARPNYFKTYPDQYKN